MAKKRHIMLLTVCLLICDTAVGLEQFNPETTVSGLYLIGGSKSLSGPEATSVLSSLVVSPSVLRQAVQSVYGEALGASVALKTINRMEEPDSGSILLNLQFGPVPGGKAKQQLLERVGENLQRALQGVYADTRIQLEEALKRAFEREGEAKAQLEELSRPADRFRSQPVLDQHVDLSVWDMETTFGDAIQILRDSADPSPGLTVLWRELDAAGFDAKDPIVMDGLGEVRLDTALDLLLRSLSAGREATLDYAVQDGTIVIGLAQDMLGTEGMMGISPTELADRRDQLNRKRQAVEMELSKQIAQREAIEEQILHLRANIDQEIEGDNVNRDLEELVEALQRGRQSLQQAFEAGRANDNDLIPILQQLAEAKIKIADRRMNLVQQHGGSILQDLNGRLIELTIGGAEQKAQLQGLGRQIRALDAQQISAGQYEIMLLSRDLVRRSLQDAMKEVHELNEKLQRLTPPSVSLVEVGH